MMCLFQMVGSLVALKGIYTNWGGILFFAFQSLHFHLVKSYRNASGRSDWEAGFMGLVEKFTFGGKHPPFFHVHQLDWAQIMQILIQLASSVESNHLCRNKIQIWLHPVQKRKHRPTCTAHELWDKKIRGSWGPLLSPVHVIHGGIHQCPVLHEKLINL